MKGGHGCPSLQMPWSISPIKKRSHRRRGRRTLRWRGPDLRIPLRTPLRTPSRTPADDDKKGGKERRNSFLCASGSPPAPTATASTATTTRTDPRSSASVSSRGRDPRPPGPERSPPGVRTAAREGAPRTELGGAADRPATAETTTTPLRPAASPSSASWSSSAAASLLQSWWS